MKHFFPLLATSLVLFVFDSPVSAAAPSRAVLELRNQVRISRAKKFSGDTNVRLAKQRVILSTYEEESCKRRMDDGFATRMEYSGAILSNLNASIAEQTASSSRDADTISESSASLRLEWALGAPETPKQLAQMNLDLTRRHLARVRAVREFGVSAVRQLSYQLDYLEGQVKKGTLENNILPSSRALVAEARGLVSDLDAEVTAATTAVEAAEKDVAYFP